MVISSRTPKCSHRQGFALVEALVSAGIIAIIAVCSIGALSVVNRIAMTNRLLTLAGTVARDQAERIQTAGPFNPRLNQIPEVLVTGTRTTVPTGYSAEFTPRFALYTEGDEPVVLGTMTTAVLDTGTLSTYAATVRVRFQYRDRTFEVARDVLRCAD